MKVLEPKIIVFCHNRCLYARTDFGVTSGFVDKATELGTITVNKEVSQID